MYKEAEARECEALVSSNVIEKLYERLKDIIDVRTLLPDTLRALATNADMVLSWLHSLEFKELCATSPYPPLLNPKEVNYEQIPAIFAWELNLPLPPFFDFIVLKGHGSGSSGLSIFLEKCDCYGFYDGNIMDATSTYVNIYNQILQGREREGTKYLFVQDFMLKGDFAKYFCLIPRKKALFLVRDPISVLKSNLTINRVTFWGGKTKFNLTWNPNVILDSLFHYGFILPSKTQNLNEMPFWINYFPLCFHDTQLLEACKEIKEVHYVDMQEIVGDRAFETMNS